MEKMVQPPVLNYQTGIRERMGRDREKRDFRPEAGSPVIQKSLIANLAVIQQHDHAGNDEGDGDKNPQQRLFICMFHYTILPKMLCIYIQKNPLKQLQQRGIHLKNHKSRVDYKTSRE
jgi:hypothetical protein